jgi:hypothetical protein
MVSGPRVPYLPIGWQLAEVTPVRGDDEEQAREGERDACDNRSSGAIV